MLRSYRRAIFGRITSSLLNKRIRLLAIACEERRLPGFRQRSAAVSITSKASLALRMTLGSFSLSFRRCASVRPTRARSVASRSYRRARAEGVLSGMERNSSVRSGCGSPERMEASMAAANASSTGTLESVAAKASANFSNSEVKPSNTIGSLLGKQG